VLERIGRVEGSKGFYRDALDIKIEDNDVLLMHWKDLPILEIFRVRIGLSRFE
jgi:hypothetical protein